MSTSSEIKVCADCALEVPVQDYYHRTDTHKPIARCRPCYRTYRKRAWHSRSPENRNERSRRHRLVRYRLTPEQFDVMLAKQSGQCSICGTTQPSLSGRKTFAVDHDHNTGRIRSLLCLKCNTGLGFFNDNPSLMEQAAQYLRLHADTEVMV